jgi:hypothetical protein
VLCRRTRSFVRRSITLPLRPKPEVFDNRRPSLIFFIGVPSYKTIVRRLVLWIFTRPRAYVNHTKVVLRPFRQNVFHRALHRVLQAIIQRVGVCNHSAAQYARHNSGTCRRTQVG